MNSRTVLASSILPAMALLGGCVMPGEIDETIVNRYQQAMALRTAQPRMGETGLDSLRPAEGVTGPALPAERIIKSKEIETTETYKLLGSEDTRKRVEIRRSVKTTTYEPDPKTGKPAPRVSLDEAKPMVAVLKEVPRDIHEVEVLRVGEKSKTPSMIADSEEMIHLSLEETILRALANNLDIRVVSYDPAVSREEMVKAAAAFDFMLFGATHYAKDEKKTPTPVWGDITRRRDWSLGVRQHTPTGADWTLEWAMTRTWDTGSFMKLFNTRYEPTVTLQVSQPLLRDAWPEFNLAQLRVARLSSRISDAEFRIKVEEVVTEVIVTYWMLVQARQELAIQQKLLAQTNETHARVRDRGLLDATLATIKQAEASVKIREAVLIRAQKNIVDVQNSLARLMADSQINLLSRCEVVPSTPPVRERVHVSATEQLLTTLRCNPLLEQARLAIAAAEINVSVAENQTLPSLKLTASTILQGLGPTIQQADDKLLNADFVSYAIGLELEHPIGNRGALANLRQRKLERTKQIVSMQNIADQIAVAVHERVRQIGTTYRETLAQRAAVEAAEVQLQALEDTERIRAQLTPEFLRVKLQAQETLANARRAELQAIVDYNNAMVELARTTGTILELHRVEVALPAVVENTWPAAAPPATAPAGDK
jgi:outer membrane protein